MQVDNQTHLLRPLANMLTAIGLPTAVSINNDKPCGDLDSKNEFHKTKCGIKGL